jgi:pimeloyl-ACP methyl ester carboxylesterase
MANHTLSVQLCALLAIIAIATCFSTAAAQSNVPRGARGSSAGYYRTGNPAGPGPVEDQETDPVRAASNGVEISAIVDATISAAIAARRSFDVPSGTPIDGAAAAADSTWIEKDPNVPTVAAAAAAAAAQSRQVEAFIGGHRFVPCPAASVRGARSGFWCGHVPMPLDHFDESDARKVMVHFAVHFAGGAGQAIPPANPGARRAIVEFEGGPGGVGHNSAGLVDRFSAMLGGVDAFDFVFMDQRGTGFSCGLGCHQTGVKYAMSGFSIAERNVFSKAVADFKRECKTEIAMRSEQWESYSPLCLQDPGELTGGEQRLKLRPHLGTDQAVRDMRAFVALVGWSKVVVYGPSYGSVGAQVYAKEFPDNVAAAVLDSPVDPRIPGSAWLTVVPAAIRDYIDRAFELCFDGASMPGCAADFGGLTREQATAAAFAAFDEVSEPPPSTPDLWTNVGWPKVVNVSYVDFGDAPAYPTIERAVTIEREALSFLAFGETTELDRALILHAFAALLKGGDWSELVRYAMARYSYLVDFESFDIRSYTIMMDSPIGNCGPIMGRDYTARLERSPYPKVNGLDAKARGKMLQKSLDVRGDYYAPFGAAYVWVPATMTAFERAHDFVYDASDPSATHTPVPTATIAARQYPIVVLGASSEMDVDVAWADEMYERYKRSGPAYRIVATDASHVLLADAMALLDPARASGAYACAFSATIAAISGAMGAPSAVVRCANPAPYPRYYAREFDPPAGLGQYTTIRALEMDASFRFLFAPIIACKARGVVAIVYKYPDGSGYTLAFRSCAYYSDPATGEPMHVLDGFARAEANLATAIDKIDVSASPALQCVVPSDQPGATASVPCALAYRSRASSAPSFPAIVDKNLI